jgi:hypothetical protein
MAKGKEGWHAHIKGRMGDPEVIDNQTLVTRHTRKAREWKRTLYVSIIY